MMKDHAKESIKRLHEVLTTENEFKPKSSSERFGVAADFLVEICEHTFSLESKVEEMQKALQFYAEPTNHDIYEINTEQGGIITRTEYWTNIMKDEGECARQALKGVINEQSN